MAEEFSKLEENLGISFKDKKLLKQAFIHRSYLNENPGLNLKNNERLEFLGDAVLELIVTKHLYETYKKPEGELTSLRAALVNTQSLSELAKELGFEKYLLLSKGESKDGLKAHNCILADTFESFLGALYIDQGIKEPQMLIQKYLIPKLPRILKEGLYRDPKSDFQEQVQDKVKITPTYKILKEWGPDHQKHFTVGVFLENKLISEGEGDSKQKAEESAAKKALKEGKWKEYQNN